MLRCPLLAGDEENRDKTLPVPFQFEKILENDKRINNQEKVLSPSAAGDAKVYESIRSALAEARTSVVVVVNSAMVSVYWEIGRQIAEAVGERAEYGRNLLAYLSERLTKEFGKGFTISNLRNMRQLYQTFPIRYALRSELTWSHYRLLMRVDDPNRRDFYLTESANSGWTSRQLERQINSFYYERLLATQKENRPEIANEIAKLEPPKGADYVLKDPYILEFLDMRENSKYSESELEQGLTDKLQEFLLELGKGFSFVARQKRITTEHGEHYYIDLVFYNFILKCFIVIDLKAGKLTYQDVGQIDFYVRLFDEKIKQADDNPTIGLILVSDKDESIVKYSVLADKENLFASKYRLYLPTEEELKQEILRERELLERQIQEYRGNNE
jgi:predicted nuclease of restriction endonuclease-like (RecB) superfamily